MNNLLWIKLDINAPSDSKCIDLRMKYGWEGFGIFVAVCCFLGGSDNAKATKAQIGFSIPASPELLSYILDEMGVFKKDAKGLYSSKRLDIQLARVETLRDNGSKGGRPKKNQMVKEEKTKRLSNPSYSSSYSSSKGFKKKEGGTGEEKTIEGIHYGPTVGEVQMEAGRIGLDEVQAERFFNHWESRNWQDRGDRLTRWKLKLKNWKLAEPDTPENKLFSGLNKT